MQQTTDTSWEALHLVDGVVVDFVLFVTSEVVLVT